MFPSRIVFSIDYVHSVFVDPHVFDLSSIISIAERSHLFVINKAIDVRNSLISTGQTIFLNDASLSRLVENTTDH